MAGIKQGSAHFWDTLKGAGKKFGAENASLLAAGISFYALLSVLPLLLLGVAVLGYVLGSSKDAYDTVVRFFDQFMPTSTVVTDMLRGLVDARGVIGIVGIVGLLWVGSQYFVTLQVALDDIWEVKNPAGFIKTRIRAILLVVTFGVFLILSIASSAAISYLQKADLGFASGAWPTILTVLAFIVSLVFAIAMFVVVYKYGHDAGVRWRSVLIGAIIAGVVWTIAKELYRLYVTYVADFNAAYGSLGGIVLLVMWIYYSSVILLFGAEIAYVDEHGPTEEPEEKERMER